MTITSQAQGAGRVAGPPADSIRAVLDAVFARPEFDWRRTENPFDFLNELFAQVVRWLAALAESHPVIYWLFVGLLVALLVAILGHLGLVVARALKPRREGVPEGRRRAVRRRDASWYLREAERLSREGRYRQALACRFVALVLELDRRSALKFHPSKTPGEYAREVRLDAYGLAVFGELVGKLYRHLFGGATCGAGDVETFDRRARELGGHVAAR